MFEIRQATEEDLALLLKWTILLHSHEDDGEIETHPNFEKNLEKWLSSEITNSNCLCLIAEIDAKPKGFIFANSVINDNGFLAIPIKGIIHLLWVDLDCRKMKIAEKLVAAVEECFKSVGITLAECNYTSNNNLAKSFWESQNYRQSAVTARKLLTEQNLSSKGN